MNFEKPNNQEAPIISPEKAAEALNRAQWELDKIQGKGEYDTMYIASTAMAAEKLGLGDVEQRMLRELGV